VTRRLILGFVALTLAIGFMGISPKISTGSNVAAAATLPPVTCSGHNCDWADAVTTHCGDTGRVYNVTSAAPIYDPSNSNKLVGYIMLRGSTACNTRWAVVYNVVTGGSTRQATGLFVDDHLGGGYHMIDFGQNCWAQCLDNNVPANVWARGPMLYVAPGWTAQAEGYIQTAKYCGLLYNSGSMCWGATYWK